MLKTFRFLITSALAICLATAFTVPAQAVEETSDTWDALQTVQELASETEEMRVLDDVAEVSVDDGLDAIGTVANDVTVDLPETTADPVKLNAGDGEKLIVSLPFTSDAVSADSVSDGIVEYDNANGSSTVPIVKQEGSVQVVTVISEPSAPTDYVYDFALADSQRLEMQDDGSVLVLNADGSFRGGIAAPWAIDAAGEAVPTHYEISGSTLTQVVNHDAAFAYPVVADPWMGIALIKSFRWVNTKKISVAVTSWMGTVTPGVAATAGWDELRTKVRASSNSRYNELMRTTYYQQWGCHANGKALIWLATIVGMDKNPTWDLEGTRPTNANWISQAWKLCNW